MNIKGYIKSGDSGKEHKVRISLVSKEGKIGLTISTIPQQHGFPKLLGLEKAEAEKLLKELADTLR